MLEATYSLEAKRNSRSWTEIRGVTTLIGEAWFGCGAQGQLKKLPVKSWSNIGLRAVLIERALDLVHPRRNVIRSDSTLWEVQRPSGSFQDRPTNVRLRDSMGLVSLV